MRKRGYEAARRRAGILALIVFLMAGAGGVRAAVVRERPPVNPIDGLFQFIPSPNYSRRPTGTQIDCVVLHSTAQNSLQETIDHFLDPRSEVSAHFVVDKDGTVVQMVPVEMRAWHAGESELDGQPGVNAYSVGIEMVNLDNGKDPYTDAQYHSVALIITLLRALYDIPDSRIVSHAQIALPPGRKVDPVGFDWNKLHALLASMSQSE